MLAVVDEGPPGTFMLLEPRFDKSRFVVTPFNSPPVGIDACVWVFCAVAVCVFIPGTDAIPSDISSAPERPDIPPSKPLFCPVKAF